jgi:peptide/nickel transport system permease protein
MNLLFGRGKRTKETIYSRPLSYYAWQRLKKNRLAMFGLVVISFSVLVAILGYLITPDSTPDGNDMRPELKIKPPGFEVTMLKFRKNEESNKVNWFYKMCFGEESDYKLIPIYKYRFEGNDIIYEEYTGSSPNNGSEIRFNLADVAYAINYKSTVVNNEEKGYMEFYEFDNPEKIKKTVSELREIVENERIVTRKYILGTDPYGRDMLSRLMLGTRVSLAVGFISVIISIVIGVLLGALAGYFRGLVDDIIMWMINVVWSIPTLLLVIAITLLLGKGFWQVFVAVGLTMWVEVARVIRGQILSLREKEFVEAGRALGFGHSRLITKHVLPNVMSPVIVISAANFASAILIEAGLSFLGIGAKIPTPSWGEMISKHREFLLLDAAYLAILPGITIMVMVLAFVLLGNGLRDALDAKSVDDSEQTVSAL